MRGWVREVRIGAAREFGARHYRGITAAEFGAAGARRLALPLAGAALGLAAWWLWHVVSGWSVSWLPVGAVAAGVVVVVLTRGRVLVPLAILAVAGGIGWLIWQAAARWTGLVVGLGLVVVGALLAAMAGRRWRRYRRSGLSMWPAAAAALALIADAAWLLR